MQEIAPFLWSNWLKLFQTKEIKSKELEFNLKTYWKIQSQQIHNKPQICYNKTNPIVIKASLFF